MERSAETKEIKKKMGNVNNLDVTFRELDQSILDILNDCSVSARNMPDSEEIKDIESHFETIVNLTAKVAALEAQLRARDFIIIEKDEEIDELKQKMEVQ